MKDITILGRIALFFKQRLPRLDQILPVYAVIAFFVYAWTIYEIAWNLNSWRFVHTPGEIFGVMAYQFSLDLFESLLALLALLFAAWILPESWLRSDFVARGTWSVVGSCTMIILFIVVVTYVSPGVAYAAPAWAIQTSIFVLLLVLLSVRISRLRELAVSLADRLLVFLFFFPVISLVSIVVVLARNLF